MHSNKQLIDHFIKSYTDIIYVLCADNSDHSCIAYMQKVNETIENLENLFLELLIDLPDEKHIYFKSIFSIKINKALKPLKDEISKSDINSKQIQEIIEKQGLKISANNPFAIYFDEKNPNSIENKKDKQISKLIKLEITVYFYNQILNIVNKYIKFEITSDSQLIEKGNSTLNSCDNNYITSLTDVKLLEKHSILKLLNISYPTLCRMRNKNIIPFVKVNGNYKYPEAKIIEFINNQTKTAKKR